MPVGSDGPDFRIYNEQLIVRAMVDKQNTAHSQVSALDVWSTCLINVCSTCKWILFKFDLHWGHLFCHLDKSFVLIDVCRQGNSSLSSIQCLLQNSRGLE